MQPNRAINVRRSLGHRPFTAAAAAHNTTRPAAADSLADARDNSLQQRMLSAALAASLLLGAGPAFAIGPVSVKLEDLQVSKTDCGGETLPGQLDPSPHTATCLAIARHKPAVPEANCLQSMFVTWQLFAPLAILPAGAAICCVPACSWHQHRGWRDLQWVCPEGCLHLRLSTGKQPKQQATVRLMCSVWPCCPC